MVDGKTLVTFHETKPFAINYFGFAIPGKEDDEARFYYNCTPKPSNSVSNFKQFSVEGT